MKAIKTLTAAALLLSAGLATTAARASDLRWSVHIGLPLPVVTLPAPVVTVPAPVYRHAPVQAPPAWRDRDRDGIADWRDPYDNRRVGPGCPTGATIATTAGTSAGTTAAMTGATTAAAAAEGYLGRALASATRRAISSPLM